MQSVTMSEDDILDLDLYGVDILDDELMHLGTPHEGSIPHSGRYPYGSGQHAFQRAYEFADRYRALKAKGVKERDMAIELGIVNHYGQPDVNRMRARYSNATNAVKAYERAMAHHLYYDECHENASEVGRRMGKSESTIRSYLDETRTERVGINQKTADVLKEYVDSKRYIDISEGTNLYLGVTTSRLKNAVALLEEQGYKKQTVKIDQLGTSNKTTLTVLTPPDCDYDELYEHRYDIRFPGQDSRLIDESGETLGFGMKHPLPIDKSRIYIRYNEEGGQDREGLIELRPGVPDLSLGGSNYAQVRMNVDDQYYLKGMARYSDDVPPGYDIIFNTLKKEGTPLEKVFKPLKKVDEKDPNSPINWDNPFGSGKLNQLTNDKNEVISACNIVRSEDEWETWSRNLPSQFLSKQPKVLAERQLKLAGDDRERELEEINSLTNPEIKKKFLLDFSQQADAAAVELKAAPFPNQQTHVLMPFPELKDTEIYDPKLPDGTRVALVRFPHQNKGEIPELTVRNTGSPAAKVLGNSSDAVGINMTVADRLSGADFDGDTVLVIPLSSKVRIQSEPQYPGLKGFEPKERYKEYPGMRIMTEREKQLEMGKISNLITDMTMQGATREHIERATRHALVVIDAAKHHLDWKASEKIENIQELKDIYQGGGGAGTIISRAKSEYRVDDRKDWYPTKDSIGPSGEKIYTSNLYRKDGSKNPNAWSLTGRLKGIPMNDGTLVDVKEERKGGEKTGRLYYNETDSTTGKKVRKYVTRDDFPDDIETLKEQRSVYLNRDKKDGGLYYLTTDPHTGKKIRNYVDPDKDLVGGVKEEPRRTKSTWMAEESDPYKLTSGGSKENLRYPIEGIYAEYALRMKGLANKARLEYVNTATYKVDKGAAIEYSDAVESLNKKLLDVKKNAPLERQAQLLGNKHVAMAKAANPGMSNEDIQKLRGRMITASREILRSQRADKMKLTQREVEAIQRNAISATKLRDILDHTDSDDLRNWFTPKNQKTITPSMKSLAKSMAASGYTFAQISERLGVSTTSVNKILKGKEEP